MFIPGMPAWPLAPDAAGGEDDGAPPLNPDKSPAKPPAPPAAPPSPPADFVSIGFNERNLSSRFSKHSVRDSSSSH